MGRLSSSLGWFLPAHRQRTRFHGNCDDVRGERTWYLARTSLRANFESPGGGHSSSFTKIASNSFVYLLAQIRAEPRADGVPRNRKSVETGYQKADGSLTMVRVVDHSAQTNIDYRSKRLKSHYERHLEGHS